MTERQDIQELIDDFALLDDWEDRYRYLIELGDNLPFLSCDSHNAKTKVEGCVSQVWLEAELNCQEEKFYFTGDSDAHIVRGLIAILLRLFSGRTREEILTIDARQVFHKIGLGEHLTPQRSNGFVAMVNRINSHANGDKAVHHLIK